MIARAEPRPVWTTANAVAPRFALCTALDDTPRLLVELILWVVCASRALPAEHFSLFVYFVGDVPADVRSWLNAKGVTLKTGEEPVPGVPHCNRLMALSDNHDVDYILLTDTDVFFLDDPRWLFNSRAIRAAPNNQVNPPPYIFKNIFKAMDNAPIYRPMLTPLPNGLGARETFINNISAGVVGVPAHDAHLIGASWRRNAEWLRDHSHLLERWIGHIDQVAFALMCEEIGRDVVHLPPQVNLIIGLLESVETCYALHLSSAHVSGETSRFLPNRHMTTDNLSGGMVDAVKRLNLCVDEALATIRVLPSLEGAEEFFLNPLWRRP